MRWYLRRRVLARRQCGVDEVMTLRRGSMVVVSSEGGRRGEGSGCQRGLPRGRGGCNDPRHATPRHETCGKSCREERGRREGSDPRHAKRHRVTRDPAKKQAGPSRASRSDPSYSAPSYPAAYCRCNLKLRRRRTTPHPLIASSRHRAISSPYSLRHKLLHRRLDLRLVVLRMDPFPNNHAQLVLPRPLALGDGGLGALDGFFDVETV